jgi:hypothetical protein
MQSKKVLIMPIRDPDRQLRHEEKPAYPDFAIEMVREFTKEFAPLREDIGRIKEAMSGMSSKLEKLDVIPEMKVSIRTLETSSQNQGQRLDRIENHTHGIRGILWFLGILGGIIVTAAAVLEIYKYLH